MPGVSECFPSICNPVQNGPNNSAFRCAPLSLLILTAEVKGL